MVRWEYEVLRQDTLKGFQDWLAMSGNNGWELVAANYVMHAPEDLPSGHVPSRAVWIGVLKRPISDEYE